MKRGEGGKKMDIEQLRTFQRVAYLRKINKAAEEFFLSQSSIISRIRSIEEDLGYELFYRTGRTIELTPKGEQFLRYVDRTLELIEEGLNKMKQSPSYFELGSVPTVASYLLPSILQVFRKISPDPVVHVSTSSTSGIVDWVMNGKVDLGLVRGPFKHLGVEAKKLSSDPIIPIVHSSHPWAKKEHIQPEDFLNVTVIAFARKSSIWSSILEWFKQNRISPRVGMELDHVETTKQMVYEQFGMAFVPLMAVKNDLATGRLKEIKLDPPLNLYRDTLIIRHRRKPLSDDAEKFWTLLDHNIVNTAD
jgi:DNA-binding transcriptional LysR family regulator